MKETMQEVDAPPAARKYTYINHILVSAPSIREKAFSEE